MKVHFANGACGLQKCRGILELANVEIKWSCYFFLHSIL